MEYKNYRGRMDYYIFIPMLCVITFTVSLMGIWILITSVDKSLIAGIFFYLFCIGTISLFTFLFNHFIFQYTITRVDIFKEKIILYHGSRSRNTEIPYSSILKKKRITHNGVPCERFYISTKKKFNKDSEEGVLLTLLFDERIQDEFEKAYYNYKKNSVT